MRVENGYGWEAVGYHLERDTQRVVKSDLPAVFRHVGAKEYKRLSPLVIRTFLMDYRRAKNFLKPYMKEYSSLQMARRYLKNKGLFMSLSLFFGKGRRKRDTLSDVDTSPVDYLTAPFTDREC